MIHKPNLSHHFWNLSLHFPRGETSITPLSCPSTSSLGKSQPCHLLRILRCDLLPKCFQNHLKWVTATPHFSKLVVEPTHLIENWRNLPQMGDENSKHETTTYIGRTRCKRWDLWGVWKGWSQVMVHRADMTTEDVFLMQLDVSKRSGVLWSALHHLRSYSSDGPTSPRFVSVSEPHE